MMVKVRFTLPASNIIGADGCALLGEFNSWNLDEAFFLEKQEDGSMTTEVELPAGKDFQYRYLLSNGRWVNDNAEKVISEMHGFPVENCLVRVPAVIKETKPKAERTRSAKPKTVKKNLKVVKDDLTKIEGIGKQIQALLYKNEICSYKDLSKATIKSLKAMLIAAGNKFSMHEPGSWPRQAKLAAAGKWDELQLMQQELKGGK